MQNTYDFCPKCGAVVRNGVCTSCGAVFGEPEAMHKTEEEGMENVGGILEEEVAENQTMDRQFEKMSAENAQIQHNGMQPGANNYYGGQAPAGYSNTGGKKNTAIWIGVLSATFLVVIILVVARMNPVIKSRSSILSGTKCNFAPEYGKSSAHPE